MAQISWTCKACKTPNILVTEDGGRYTLTCDQCGHPADILDPAVGWSFDTNASISTCSTVAAIDDAFKQTSWKGTGPKNWRI